MEEEITEHVEYAETIEIEEVTQDEVETKTFRGIIKEFRLTDDEDNALTTMAFTPAERTDCIERITSDNIADHLSNNPPKTSVILNPANASRNNRGSKRHITNVTIDPNKTSLFVCAEHDENISLDCRYCRIASGYKKQKISMKKLLNDEAASNKKGSSMTPRAIQNVQKPAFRAEWLTLPEFRDWLVKDTVTSHAKCKLCGTLLANVTNTLVRHAISNRHLAMADLLTVHGKDRQRSSRSKMGGDKEEVFGQYVACELSRIKNEKTYKEAKWKILRALQNAAENEANDISGTDSPPDSE